MRRPAAVPGALAACLLLAPLGGCGGPDAAPADAQAKAASAEKAETAPAEALEAQPVPEKAPPKNAEHASICRATMVCAADCFREAGAPAQSLAECDQPSSPECTAAIKAAMPAALEVTMNGLRCAMPCGKEHRSLENLQGVDPEQWKGLAAPERASWTGLIAARDCVPGASCDVICDGDYPPPKTVLKTGERKAKAASGRAEKTEGGEAKAPAEAAAPKP